VVGRSASNFRTAAETRGVALEVDVPANALVVDGDPEALELMLNNLLDNAVKYTGSGGAVRVRLASEGGEGRIDVSDNGIGIAPDHHDRIFERFYRVDQARSRELGGTGLGLSIVKHVCKAHRGTISLESALGVGSTFRVRLPLA
jgi:signal transduction histidine kinase